eukprot:Gb_27831 [translate_table: standard]
MSVEMDQKQVCTVRPRRMLLLGAAFTASLVLGFFLLSFDAFFILPKWIQLPRFIGMVHKSQISSIATSLEHKNIEIPGEAMKRIQTLFFGSSLHPTTPKLSSKEEVSFTRKNVSFHYTSDSITAPKPSPARNNNASEKVVNPGTLIIGSISTTVSAPAKPPSPSIKDEKGSIADSSKKSFGNVKNSSRDAAVKMGLTEKAKKTMLLCNILDGKWVLDNSYPLYRNSSCPFIDEGFNCQANGRPDSDYMKLRWQPRDCILPRFNATDMLERLRGKRLVFVGDSINRNQWASMLCMLSEAVPDKRKVFETHRRKITKGKGFYTFKFTDYHCTVEYYVTHFLVQEGKARLGRKKRTTLRIDRIDKASSKWKGADILVFNSAHWWTHTKTAAGQNYYQEGDQVHPHLDVLTAYRRALMTWASWIDTHIDSSKSQVFFRSYSPPHFWGGQWNSGGRCEGETQPILNGTLLGHYPVQMTIVEEVIQQMKTPVTLLNVTRLTDFRKDGHPSVYGKQLVDKKASNIQDCSHWCLPGVPDSWNELLYAFLVLKKKGFYSSRIV